VSAPPVRIRTVETLGEREIDGLCRVLVDCVEGGASVSFMRPMTPQKARAFWTKVAAGVQRGERIVVVAEESDGTIVGTAQVVNAESENQPHRADIAKMLVHRRARKRGVGALLLKAAEEAALRAGKSLLVLDTASADAERLYERNGWKRVGEIPNYALLPDGPPCATIVFFKQLAE